ncbi:MAG: hypothetical protein PVF65_09720, partial [Sphingomonadales bacterium]
MTNIVNSESSNSILKSLTPTTKDGQRMLLLAAIAVSYIICVNIVARLYGIQEYSELFSTSRIGMAT